MRDKGFTGMVGFLRRLAFDPCWVSRIGVSQSYAFVSGLFLQLCVLTSLFSLLLGMCCCRERRGKIPCVLL